MSRSRFLPQCHTRARAIREEPSSYAARSLSPVCQTRTSITQPRTRSQRLPGQDTGERGCTVSPPLCPHLGEKKLRCLRSGSVRLTGQMLLLKAGHSWLDPCCYASILPQAAVTATFPTH
ncbi:hypothetical protein CesoFtcFv8_027789 [Champsocephalus esox]|uniref:Uncharacterized protein n=2 Tax=Champsocephalus TaxID=52236 RepID=A0AAN8GXD8_CHAGU|nr:hypothetical protein CesoFtcFv8_027789 [Champsocephalus esox]KAK5891504.1 hypothetical protein CgunFtcFv8_018750 [Champsocephalus gunnari]